MSRFNAILMGTGIATLLIQAGHTLTVWNRSPEAAKAAGCALWLAQALGATLHVLHATAHPLSAQDAHAVGLGDAAVARQRVRGMARRRPHRSLAARRDLR